MSDPGPNATAQQILAKIPQGFVTDGCSSAPDSILGRDLRWCCKIHDWRYCTRAHRAGAMNFKARTYADKELGWHIRDQLPFGLRWVSWLYYRVTYRLGGMGAFNSCGPQVGKRCRHNLKMPDWMKELACRESSEDEPTLITASS